MGLSIFTLIFLLFSVNASAGITDWIRSFVDQPLSKSRSEQIGGESLAAADASAGKSGSRCLDDLKKEQEAALAERERVIDGIVKPGQKGFSQMSCLDKYKNANIGSSLGVPDLGSLLDQLTSQACQALDAEVSGASAPLNQNVWLPGGVQVNTGVFTGQPASGGAVVGKPTVQNSRVGLPDIFK